MAKTETRTFLPEQHDMHVWEWHFRPPMPAPIAKRVPQIIKVRCYLNGADTTRLVYLLTSDNPVDVMRKYVPRHERNSLRLLERRPATFSEIQNHALRLAAL